MSNKKTVCILTQSHLCRNPRVQKEAITLANEGYTVHIVTNCLSGELYEIDLQAIAPYPSISITTVADLSKPGLTAFSDRLLYKLGRLLIRAIKLETSLSLGYGALRFYRLARKINADLYICHQELATYTGNRLLAAKYRVAFDLEDWYSEDLLSEARTERPLKMLKKMECTALNNGAFCITTSNVLAQKLAATYNSPLPHTIYNVFPAPEINFRSRSFNNPLKLFWFSQTVGPGRGLESFIRILTSLENKTELHLLGMISSVYREFLISIFPDQHELHFHEIIEGPQLAQKIAGFDIGLALELDYPLSRNFTITNKFFQYLQSGLPVIASETLGQKEAFENFKPGFMLPQTPGNEEINVLHNWLNDPAALQAARTRAIEAANNYNWENESLKLVKLVKDAM